MSVFKGIFFSEGVQYKYVSSYNTRLICQRMDDPLKEIQFSCYDTVQVPDEEASEIKAFLIDVLRMERNSVFEKERDIKRLGEQGVTSYLDHLLEPSTPPVIGVETTHE